MWTKEQLKNYKGGLCITRDFRDEGFAFIEYLEIYTFEDESDEPVYKESFSFDGEIEEFLTSLGFVEDKSEAGFIKYPDRLYDKWLFDAVTKIGNIIFEYASSDPNSTSGLPWLADRRNQMPNPYYNQTKSGIFLEMYYGTPTTLWTPWGRISIGGSSCGDFTIINEKLLKRLGGELYIPEKQNNMGLYGPVYKLSKLDNEILPKAEPMPIEDFGKETEIRTAWKMLLKGKIPFEAIEVKKVPKAYMNELQINGSEGSK